MAKVSKSKEHPKERSKKYDKPFTVNASFEDFIKIAVTPKEDLKQEDFKFKKG